MAKVAYVPYDETMAAIFAALNIETTTADFGGETGWSEDEYVRARSAAWDALFLLDTIDYNNDGTDDWDYIDSLIHGDFTVRYWSTESGHAPY